MGNSFSHTLGILSAERSENDGHLFLNKDFFNVKGTEAM